MFFTYLLLIQQAVSLLSRNNSLSFSRNGQYFAEFMCIVLFWLYERSYNLNNYFVHQENASAHAACSPSLSFVTASAIFSHYVWLLFILITFSLI